MPWDRGVTIPGLRDLETGQIRHTPLGHRFTVLFRCPLHLRLTLHMPLPILWVMLMDILPLVHGKLHMARMFIGTVLLGTLRNVLLTLASPMQLKRP